MSAKKSDQPRDPSKKSVTNDVKDSVKSQNDTPDIKNESTSLRDHPNKYIRFFANAGFTVWIIVMVVGLSIAFVVSVFLL